MKITTLITFVSICFIIFSCKNPSSPIKEIPYTEIIHPVLDSLNIELDSFNQKKILPGFAVSIFSKDSIFFKKAFGYADLASQQKMQPNTVQSIASISKTMVSICLMKAIEEGKLSLNTPINQILPYKISNPHFPNTEITIQHLATHTSSISDDENYNKAYIFSQPLQFENFPKVWEPHLKKYNKNVPYKMNDFLEKIFSPDGEWFSPKNFHKTQPGTAYEYSNIAIALLAHCIEIVTGKDFKTYSDEVIFTPLQLTQTSWDRNFNSKNHITYYNEIYNPVPAYEVITYPDGGIFTSVDEMTIFLQEMIKGYQGKSDLLSPKSFQIMMKNQVPNLDTPTGVIWDLEQDCCIGHGGNDFGVATLMYFSPKTGLGKILFSNLGIEKEEQGDAFYSTFNMMFKYDLEIQKLMNSEKE